MKKITIILLIFCSTKAYCQLFPELQDNGSGIYTQYPDYGEVVVPSIKVKNGIFGVNDLNGYKIKYYATGVLMPEDTILSNEIDSNFKCIFTTEDIQHNIYDGQELSCQYSYIYYPLQGFENNKIWFRITLIKVSTGIESPVLLTLKIPIKQN